MSITNKVTIGYIAIVTVAMIILMIVVTAFQPAQSNDAGISKPLVSVEDKVAFLDTYEKDMGPIDSDDEEELVASGMTLCYVLQQNDGDMPTAWRAGVDELGYSSDQSAAILNSAVRTLCPNTAR